MEARRLRSGLQHGIRTALRNNVSAYGFSVMITASFGVLTASLGSPSVGDVFLFAAGGVTGVTVIEGISSRGFREKMRGDPSDIVALGSAIGSFSVGVAIGAAALVALALTGGVGWAVGAMAASAIYVLISGAEMALARILQEDRERADEREDTSHSARQSDRTQGAHGFEKRS